MNVCWSNNCRGANNDQLYIMHAVESGGKTLCGVEIQEIGEPVSDEHPVGCKRCQAIIAKRTPTVGNAQNRG